MRVVAALECFEVHMLGGDQIRRTGRVLSSLSHVAMVRQLSGSTSLTSTNLAWLDPASLNTFILLQGQTTHRSKHSRDPKTLSTLQKSTPHSFSLRGLLAETTDDQRAAYERAGRVRLEQTSMEEEEEMASRRSSRDFECCC